MWNYSTIKNKPHILHSLTDWQQEDFCRLVEPFDRAYHQHVSQPGIRPDEPRPRKPGRKATLATSEDKLLFILFYFKFHPNQELLGSLFGISQVQANHWVHRLTPVLNTTLGYEQQLPLRKTMNRKQMLVECPILAFILEDTKQPVQHLNGKDRQPDYRVSRALAR